MEQCEYCGATVETVEEALDALWIFSYIDYSRKTVEEKGTLCLKCQEKLNIRYDKRSYEYYKGRIKRR